MRTSTADVDHSDAPYVIVSSDTHAGLKPEEYRPYLDQRYRAQFDEWVRNRHQHRVLIEEVNGDYVEAWERDNAEGLRGASDPAIRDRYLDADGVAGEIIFADGDSVTGQESPPFGAGLAAGQITDPELAFAGARAHNRWLAEFCATDPVRRAGVGLVPIIHGVKESLAEIAWLAGRPGIRGVMVPTMWHDKPSYGHPMYDPIWAACADAGLVVHTHSGEGDWASYNENLAQFVLEVPFWTHRILWQLLLSGKFDRFPDLRYVVVECGSYWLGDLLWKADTTFGANRKVKKLNSRTKGLIKRLPSEYIGTNVFIGASTMSREEIRRRHTNGIDALMWGTDYPHPEGSWPNTGERLRTDFRDVSIGDTRLLLGLNAVECYRLDRTALQGVAERIGPRPSDLGQDPDLRTPHDAVRTARWWFDDYGMTWPAESTS
ncbi:MAG: amidohydrolase [Actinobacteria bacterium]|nr:amidohydrolase [Actinomycetota bacterium]